MAIQLFGIEQHGGCNSQSHVKLSYVNGAWSSLFFEHSYTVPFCSCKVTVGKRFLSAMILMFQWYVAQPGSVFEKRFLFFMQELSSLAWGRHKKTSN